MNVKLTDKQKIKILNSDDIFDVMQRILRRNNKIDREKEHLWIVGLNTSNIILFIELVSMGGVRTSTVEPMNVYRVAVLKGAIKVILVHNHPSGELKPSENDKDITDRLIQVGKILNIELFDHLIITLKSFLSFENIGLLQKLRESTEWVPSYQLEQKIRREERKIRKEAVKNAKEKGIIKGEIKGKKEGIIEGKKEREIEMAKSSLKEGLPIKLISKLTGLSKKEIEKLKNT